MKSTALDRTARHVKREFYGCRPDSQTRDSLWNVGLQTLLPDTWHLVKSTAADREPDTWHFVKSTAVDRTARHVTLREFYSCRPDSQTRDTLWNIGLQTLLPDTWHLVKSTGADRTARHVKLREFYGCRPDSQTHDTLWNIGFQTVFPDTWHLVKSTAADRIARFSLCGRNDRIFSYSVGVRDNYQKQLEYGTLQPWFHSWE